MGLQDTLGPLSCDTVTPAGPHPDVVASAVPNLSTCYLDLHGSYWEAGITPPLKFILVLFGDCLHWAERQPSMEVDMSNPHTSLRGLVPCAPFNR